MNYDFKYFLNFAVTFEGHLRKTPNYDSLPSKPPLAAPAAFNISFSAVLAFVYLATAA